MTKTKPDHDADHDSHDNDNDANKAPVAVAPAGGALASLTALGAVLNAVDTASVIGRSGMPMLQFKRDGNGTWTFGQRRTVVEDGSRWAVNPTTFKRGYICFGDGNKVLGERLVSVSQEMPDLAELPDKGVPVAGAMGRQPEVPRRHRRRHRGDLQADDRRRHPSRRRIDRGGTRPAQQRPARRQGLADRAARKGFLPAPQYGKVWTPMLTVVDWMPLSGPAPAPKPASPPPTEQPRRRRVG